jgi:hypothetical protein
MDDANRVQGGTIISATTKSAGGDAMVKFYDPKDAADLARVEAILKQAGIEYFLGREPEKGIGPCQVQVAEEDLPTAEKLLQESRKA